MESASIKTVSPQIVTALKGASRATGADFDYLLKTAMRESALKPHARAKTSSASGLFQFIEQTWLGTLKNAGGKHGLSKLSALIHQDRSGKFNVADPAKRKALLALRFDPKLSALMAGEFTRANQMAIRRGIGRAPTDGELYIGHFLGAGQASKLINMAAKTPNVSADAHFPRAARANKAIFYRKSGKARSIADVYQNLTHHYRNEIAGFSSPEAPKANSTAGKPSETAGPVRPLTHALFTLWRTPGQALNGSAGAATTFHNLFLPGQKGSTGRAPAAFEPSRAGGSQDAGKSTPRDDYIPPAEAFLSAFGAGKTASTPAAPDTRTAAGRINGAWGETIKASGLLSRRRPGAI